MTQKDLAQIESELGVKLPKAVQRFMLEHGAELAKARRTLAGEVVLESSAKAIVKLNKALRKHGIEVGPDATPAPWPVEYLALSDNGAGDHECVKLDEPSGAVHLFNGEEGRFTRKHATLDAYLAELGKRLAKFQKSPAGKSDVKLLKRAPVLHATAKALNVPVLDAEPPVTPAKLRALGIDTDRLESELAALLEAVTGIGGDQWTIRTGKGEYPVQVGLSYATKAKPRKPFTFDGFQIYNGDLRLTVKVADAKTPLDASAIDWDRFSDALGGLYATVLRTPVRMTPGKIKVSPPTEYGYVGFQCSYVMAKA